MDDKTNRINIIFSNLENYMDHLSMNEESEKISDFATGLATAAITGIHSGSPMYKEFADTFLSAFINQFNQKLEAYKEDDGFDDDDDGNITLTPWHGIERPDTTELDNELLNDAIDEFPRWDDDQIEKTDDLDQEEAIINYVSSQDSEPGYLFFGDEEDIDKFNELWTSDRKNDALEMIKNDPELDLITLEDYKNFIQNM